MIDCTASMKAHVKAATESVKAVVDEMEARPNSKVKFAIVTYTDLNHEEEVRFNTLNFTEDGDQAATYLEEHCRLGYTIG